MIRQSIFLAISFTLSTAFECNLNNACDNEIALCGEGSQCVNPSGQPLGGCCVPKGTKIEDTEQQAVADYVKENCGHAFACDNGIATCWSHSKCVNPSGEPLSGCCIPNEMDPNEMNNGVPSADVNGETKKVSEWEHLRGVVADYVIDNCGPAFACDNEAYGCGDHSQCVNPSGEMLSGCCIPKEMDPNEMEKGLPLDSTKKISEWEHLRGVVADYVVDNCSPAFACDNNDYGCGDDSKCVNPSGEMLSGCCIPNTMDPEQIESGIPLKSAKKISDWEHLRGVVADFVIDNCGPAFACDNTAYGCGDHSKCVNPSGEMLSGCCIPNNMDPEQIEAGLPLESAKKFSEWEHLRGVVADYVIDNCGPAFACDNTDYRCGDESKCVNPSGEILSGCCIPSTMDPEQIDTGLPLESAKKISEWEHLRGVVADYVIDNCGPAFACDNTDYGCGDDSQCVNPSGKMLSGCCIPSTMDPEQIETGLPLESAKKISEWEHLRGVVADYVIDNCGPAFACDNTDYGCGGDSKCVNSSGEMLSGCCIPNGMDPNEMERGLPLESANDVTEKKISEWEHLRGVVADYVIDNCGPAFACDNTAYGCADHSKCINPSGEMLSGCCIQKEMDVNNIEKGLPEKRAELDLYAHLRGVVADYVIENCGIAFACDGDYGCADHSQCVNPSGDTMSGCCIPKTMDPNEMGSGLPLSDEGRVQETETNGPSDPSSLRGLISDYVADYCGPAFACDNNGATCGDESECINPSGEVLSGCCVPKGMTREDLEGTNTDKFEPQIGEFGTLNGIDLKSLIAPYVLEHCGPAFACDDIAAHCAEHSSCINPSTGPLAGCCVPKGMTREELETGALNLPKTVTVDEEVVKGTESICSANAGQCIPRVFMANETKYHEEL